MKREFDSRISHKMKKHPIKIPYYKSLEKLADNIGNLRYDLLVKFLTYLAEKIYQDALKDKSRGRPKLSQTLNNSAKYLRLSRDELKRAWRISKPYMKKELK